jgi:pimeloyl-ACP methyl ester carboxylesterase
MQRLAQEFHIYAVDRPGHGLADHFDYRGVEVLPHAVNFIRGILDSLEIKHLALVGNSLGGRWAIEYALSQPDRVSHVVLPGLPAGAARELPRQFYEGVKMLRLIQRPLIGTLVRYFMAKPSSRERARKGMEGVVFHPERLSDETLDSGTHNFLRNRHSMLTLVEQVVDDVGMRPEFVLGDRWGDLGVPTTFLWGEKDVFGSPKLGREAASQVPDGKFILIPDSGHAPWVDDPDLVAKGIAGAVLGG